MAEFTPEDAGRIGKKLAPYNPTNKDCIAIALEMMNIRDEDILFDLGCGDGRLLIEAIKTNSSVRAIGVEYDLSLCEKARSNIISSINESQEKAQIIHDNVLNVDISMATVIFIYLVPEGIAALRDTLIEALLRGVRIVTYVFSISQLTPSRIEVYKSSTKLYLYDSSSLRATVGQIRTVATATEKDITVSEACVRIVDPSIARDHEALRGAAAEEYNFVTPSN